MSYVNERKILDGRGSEVSFIEVETNLFRSPINQIDFCPIVAILLLFIARDKPNKYITKRKVHNSVQTNLSPRGNKITLRQGCTERWDNRPSKCFERGTKEINPVGYLTPTQTYPSDRVALADICAKKFDPKQRSKAQRSGQSAEVN